MTSGCAGWVVIAALAGCGGAAHVARGPAAELAIRDVRVFDGAQVLEHQTVLVGGGRVVALGPVASVAVPAGARVVEGAGGTLLPGLVDSHAHVNLDEDPVDALATGVTAELDMMSSPEVSVRLARDGASAHARVFPAGNPATAPGGHGTEYGVPIPTLTTPAEAEAFVAARVAEGSHHLKIILENGDELGMPVPTLDEPTVHALVMAAHAHHLLAVAHVGSAHDVDVALAGGVDGLVHVPAQALAPAVIATIAARHLFVAPTLTVLGTFCHRETGAALAADPRLAPLLMPETIANLTAKVPPFPRPQLECAAPAQTVAALRVAGVSILAGTDAPNAGTAHGASVHDELAALVAAGLTPTEALVAATAAPARAFGLDDLGVIRPGALADLLLVDGDPTHDITQSRAIRGVWREGHAFDLDARRSAVIAALQAAAAAPPVEPPILVGPLADFEHGNAPRIGRIEASSDQLMGGTSTSAIAVIAGGPPGSTHALAVSGTVVVGPRGGFAGTSFLPGASGMELVDLTSVHRVTFWVRGDGKPYQLFLSTAATLAAQPFVAGPDWARVTIELAGFHTPLDTAAALTWATTAAGAFAFQIDQITLE